jgi:chromosomal replication initiation ATPase DnaA
MYLCRELTELSPAEIGARFGSRDHTVAMHAERQVHGQMTERFDVRNQIVE